MLSVVRAAGGEHPLDESGEPARWRTVASLGMRHGVPADAEQVPTLRHAAQTFAADYTDLDTQRAVALAVTEACANVVRHAYPNRQPGMLTLTGQLDLTHLTFEITDHGVGLDHPTHEPSLGMGLAIMHSLADTHITSNSHGTHVQLRFPRTVTPD